MQLELQGVTVTVDEKAITKLLLERLSGVRATSGLGSIQIPRIGEYWPGQGGIFTGIGIGNDDRGDVAVITAESDFDAPTWNAATEKAEAYSADGHRDFSLPWRSEQPLQFANLRARFKPEAYWSREQHREHSGCAWYQYFTNGNQDYGRQSLSYVRACAVRRFPIR